MSRRVLCVDDDPNILRAYSRTLRNKFELDTAASGEEALRILAERGPYAVVVSDMRMPGMDGVELLRRVRETVPDTVRMMLTGNADQQTAIDAVNEGHIFRFITKPCPPEVFARMIEAGLEQYRLVTAERELLSKTLAGSIKVLAEILALAAPEAFGRATRARELVRKLCEALAVTPSWPIEVATMLAPIGLLAVPQEILQKAIQGRPLKESEKDVLESHPRVARELVSKIPRLDPVAEIVAYQGKLFNGQGYPPDWTSGEDIPLGSRILKLAFDWDDLTQAGLSPDFALAEIADRRGWYDPKVVAALRRILDVQEAYVVREVRIADLVDDWIIADNIYSVNGTLLCSKGQPVTAPIRLRLRNYAINVGISRPIRVFVPLSDVPQETEA